MKRLLTLLITLGALLCLTACQPKENKNSITVGAMAGPESELMDTVKAVMKKDYGIDMKIVTFTSYALPNEALSTHDLDANYFQHTPYLNDQIKDRHYKIMSIGNGFIYPMGIYSKKITALTQLPIGAKVGVPNDPSNEARALLLLEHAGLIKLRTGAGVNATVVDIVSNPKKLNIVALDAAQLPRALSDLSIAVINNTYAVLAGFTLKNALFAEDKSSLYVNIIVVRTDDKDRPALIALVKAMHSPEVVAKAHTLFGDGVIKGW